MTAYDTEPLAKPCRQVVITSTALDATMPVSPARAWQMSSFGPRLHCVSNFAVFSMNMRCVALLLGLLAIGTEGVAGRTLPVPATDLSAPSPRATIITPSPDYEPLMWVDAARPYLNKTVRCCTGSVSRCRMSINTF